MESLTCRAPDGALSAVAFDFEVVFEVVFAFTAGAVLPPCDAGFCDAIASDAIGACDAAVCCVSPTVTELAPIPVVSIPAAGVPDAPSVNPDGAVFGAVPVPVAAGAVFAVPVFWLTAAPSVIPVSFCELMTLTESLLSAPCPKIPNLSRIQVAYILLQALLQL